MCTSTATKEVLVERADQTPNEDPASPVRTATSLEHCHHCNTIHGSNHHVHYNYVCNFCSQIYRRNFMNRDCVGKTTGYDEICEVRNVYWLCFSSTVEDDPYKDELGLDIMDCTKV